MKWIEEFWRDQAAVGDAQGNFWVGTRCSRSDDGADYLALSKSVLCELTQAALACPSGAAGWDMQAQRIRLLEKNYPLGSKGRILPQGTVLGDIDGSVLLCLRPASIQLTVELQGTATSARGGFVRSFSCLELVLREISPEDCSWRHLCIQQRKPWTTEEAGVITQRAFISRRQARWLLKAPKRRRKFRDELFTLFGIEKTSPNIRDLDLPFGQIEDGLESALFNFAEQAGDID